MSPIPELPTATTAATISAAVTTAIQSTISSPPSATTAAAATVQEVFYKEEETILQSLRSFLLACLTPLLTPLNGIWNVIVTIASTLWGGFHWVLELLGTLLMLAGTMVAWTIALMLFFGAGFGVFWGVGWLVGRVWAWCAGVHAAAAAMEEGEGGEDGDAALTETEGQESGSVNTAATTAERDAAVVLAEEGRMGDGNEEEEEGASSEAEASVPTPPDSDGSPATVDSNTPVVVFGFGHKRLWAS